MNIGEFIPSKMNKRAEIIVGIDPDCEKSGVATLQRYNRELEVTTLTFPDLLKYLYEIKVKCDTNDIPYIVVIEASWLIKTNWHLNPNVTRRRASKIGRDVGRNHETGIKIMEMCQAMNIPVKEQRPLIKGWTKGKISHDELSYFVTLPTKKAKRTNQEERDAILLAWNEANLPIKIKVKSKSKDKVPYVRKRLLDAKKGQPNSVAMPTTRKTGGKRVKGV